MIVSVTTRQLVIVGVLGGFTTFSAFSLQTLTLLREGQFAAAMANVLLSVCLGLFAAWGGEELARRIWISS
jgi:CrcB protein